MPTIDAILQFADRIRTSLWFIPGLMALGAVVLAVLTLAADHAVPDAFLDEVPLVFSGRPAGARAVLTTIAASMITTAGVVFSMTIVSLQLASSQFGPRLLRTFLRDRGNQVVLGTFVGIFLYCILVLPTIDATAGSIFVPHIAVTTALLLAVVGLAMFVYFIDHVAQSIHADAVIRSVARELDTVIDQLFPESLGEADADPEGATPEEATDESEAVWTVTSCGTGYLRFINGDALFAAAAEHDLVVRVESGPGLYVFEDDVLASVRPASAMTDGLADCLRAAFMLGAHRTPLQDVSFAFEQLVEMAVRALSSGVNDPTTAIHCIDSIGSSLARFAGRRRPSPLRRDDEGVVRVVAEPVRLERIIRETVDPIARNAGNQLMVWLRLLEVLEKVSDRARCATDRDRIRRRALRLRADAQAVFPDAEERSRIDDAAAWATDET